MNENFKDETFIAFFERTIHKLWVLCIILIALLVVTNVSWICYESQFETIETTTIDAEQETADGGNNTIVGGDYGTTESENNEN